MPGRQPESDVMLILGEIKGQLRELIHTGNNTSTKVDALALRVAALEGEKSRREGQASLIHSILKSPIVGWIVGAALTVWALLTGRVHV